MHRFPLLFEPYKINSVSLKNKITMAPLFTASAHKDGTVSSLTLEHYKEIAEGGAGMIVVANAIVDESGSVSKYSIRVDDDRFLPGLSRLADTIKKEDVAAVLQINHGGHFAQGKKTFSPSSVSLSDLNLAGLYKTALKSLDFQQQLAVLSEAIQQHPKRPKKMTEDDIKYIVSAYAQAALRAKKAGFDMVEIHGASGYLPVQFLSPRINNRKDQYGGNLENRMRFPLELTQAVMASVGSDFPVGYRFLADEWIEEGFSLNEAKIFAQRLSALHIGYLSVTGGTYESFSRPEVEEKSHEPGYMVYLAQQIKEVHNPRKKILIAMDESENATIAAAYAADMLANRTDVIINLFHIATDESIKDESGIREMMDIARSILIKAGIPEKAINIEIRQKKAGMGNDILNEIVEAGYGTVVVGRRGVSRAHQLLFGSVSNKIVQNAKDCAVWVVE